MLSMDQVVNLQDGTNDSFFSPSFPSLSFFKSLPTHKGRKQGNNKQLPPGMMTMPFMAASNQCCGVTWFWTRLELPVPGNKTKPESGLISGIGSREPESELEKLRTRLGIRFLPDSI
jgi:hypothetical protein